MKTLRVGVIGLGLIGSLHARILSEIPNAKLVSVADINGTLAAKIAKQYKCNYYTDYKALCDAGDLDAVCICTPDQFHNENAVYAAKKGLHLLVEKPLAQTEKSAREIVATAKEMGVRLMVAHLLHFDPRYVKVKEAVERGMIGDVIHMFFKRTNPRANGRRLGGKVSIFYFIGVHDIEMMCCYAKSRPVKAYCQKVSKINADIGCEDTIMAIVNFENGALGTVELCWALPENHALGINTYAEIVGINGVGYVDVMDQGVAIITKEDVFYPDILNWPEYNGNIKTESLLEKFDLLINVNLKIEKLTVGQQQMIEIAKAYGNSTWIMIMDEPTSAISEADKDRLFDIIRELKENNVAIIYISHRMSEIFEIADEITVLRDGQHVITSPVDQVDEDKVIMSMVGRDIGDVFTREKSEIGPPILEVKNLFRKKAFEPISFEVRKGEVLGFSGLVGAGRTEIMRCIFGLDKADGGEIYLNGKKLNIKSPVDAMREGILLVSEDR